MIAALLLVLLLLLFLYRSFRVAFAMLTVVLLAIAAIFVGLWVTGTELDIMSIMGMTMIVGIVTEVSIFYYSEFLDEPREAGSAPARLTRYPPTHRSCPEEEARGGQGPS